MKCFSSLIVSLIFAAGALADTKFPRGTLQVAHFEKAKALATTEKKELAFIDTDTTNSCGLCQ
jgi:hypothetical protein